MEETLEELLKKENDTVLQTIGTALERTNNELRKIEEEGNKSE